MSKRKRPSMRALLRRLDEFEALVREHEMRGSKHPEDADQIERDYEVTKAEFVATLTSLVVLAETPS